MISFSDTSVNHFDKGKSMSNAEASKIIDQFKDGPVTITKDGAKPYQAPKTLATLVDAETGRPVQPATDDHLNPVDLSTADLNDMGDVSDLYQENDKEGIKPGMSPEEIVEQLQKNIDLAAFVNKANKTTLEEIYRLNSLGLKFGTFCMSFLLWLFIACFAVSMENWPMWSWFTFLLSFLASLCSGMWYIHHMLEHKVGVNW